MDTHENHLPEYLEYLETAESQFIPSSPVVPTWEKRKTWKLWSPLINEYHNVVDNPSRLPTILQPLLSKQRAFTFGKDHPSYINYQLHVSDEWGVDRRLYITLCQENLIVGAVGALLVGFGTRHFKISQSLLHSLKAQRLVLGKPMPAARNMAISSSILVASLIGKIIIRGVTGGVLYDTLKRSREEKHGSDAKKLMNTATAGGICGLVFGFRGGLPQAWIAALATSAGTVASEFVTIPKMFSTHDK